MPTVATQVFNIGDRIEIIGTVDNLNGKIGTIINILQHAGILIEFDNSIQDGHDNNGMGNISGRLHHCWWVQATQLKLIKGNGKSKRMIVKQKTQLQEFKEWYTKYRSSAIASESDIKKMEEGLALLQKQIKTTKQVASKDTVHGMWVGARVIALKDGVTRFTGTVTSFNTDKTRLIVHRDDMALLERWICDYVNGKWWADGSTDQHGVLVIIGKDVLKAKVKDLKAKIEKAKQERKGIDGKITGEYKKAYRSLLKHHQIEKIKVNGDYLVVHTINLKHEGRKVELGAYGIETHYSIARPHIHNMTYTVQYAHPHVNSNGVPCFGAYGDSINTFFRSGDIVMYFDALIMFLKHADTPGDCHMSFNDFLEQREKNES